MNVWEKRQNKNRLRRVLIYTRPQNIKFPLFDKAQDRLKQNQPAYELLVDELQASVFSVNINIESFTDQEIDEGISEIKKYYDNPEVYTLIERA